MDNVFGLARNARLTTEIETDMTAARAAADKTAKPARRFRDFRWSTLKSWSRARRVIGKTEWTRGEANPHFIVTSLTPAEIDARRLYEVIYCARGVMENRIKECQLDLFADRTSTATMAANQLRLWFFRLRLCAVVRAAPYRPGAHPVRAGHLWHDPAEAAEDRRPGPHQRAPDQRRHGLRLPVPARVRAGTRLPAKSRDLSVTKQTPHRPHIPHQTCRRSRRSACAACGNATIWRT